jgi:lysozyme
MAIAVLVGLVAAVLLMAHYQGFDVGAEIAGVGDQISGELQQISGELGLTNDPIELALPIIKEFEGFSARAYEDPKGSGKYSIGYGHQIRPGDPYDRNSVISEPEAADICRVDVGSAYACVSQNVTVELQPQQIAALVSFAFNEGNGAFRGSTLLRLVNQGDFEGAAAQFPAWVYMHENGQLVKSASLESRRQQEADLFLS